KAAWPRRRRGRGGWWRCSRGRWGSFWHALFLDGRLFVRRSSLRDRQCNSRVGYFFVKGRHFIPSPTLQGATVAALEGAAPLLEEEWNLGSTALIADCGYPASEERPGPRPRLASHNDPVNV